MARGWQLGSSVVFLLATLAGCAICDNCDDEAYSAYGGRWQRTDRYHGIVGSVFAPAGAPVSAEPLQLPGATLVPSDGIPAPTLESVPDFMPELLRPPEPTIQAY